MALVFYWHPHNSIAKKLAEYSEVKGFLYQNRGELEFKLARMIGDIGYDVYPQFHTVIGSIANPIDSMIPMNPDEVLDRHTLKLLKTKAPWSFCKVINGPTMSCVVGYCSSTGGNPYAMTDMQRVQAGLTGGASFMPRLN